MGKWSTLSQEKAGRVEPTCMVAEKGAKTRLTEMTIKELARQHLENSALISCNFSGDRIWSKCYITVLRGHRHWNHMDLEQVT